MTPVQKRSRQRRAVWLVLSLLLNAAAVLAVGIGPVPVPPGEVLRALTDALAGRPEATPADAIVRIRLPRVELAAVVGAGLATSGAALQGLFKNAMADPYLLGISGGALGARWPLPWPSSGRATGAAVRLPRRPGRRLGCLPAWADRGGCIPRRCCWPEWR